MNVRPEPWVGVVPLPHRELLPGLRVGVGLPGAGHRPLPLPGEVGVGGLAVGERGRRRQLPPAAPPHVARHLVQAHADVGGDPRVAVERAVVVVVRPVVARIRRQPDVVPAEHLAGRLVPGDGRVDVAVRLGPGVVEQPEVHRRDQAVHQVAEFGHGLPDHDQPRGVPAVVHVGDEEAVVEGRRGLGAVTLARVGQHVAVGGVVPLVQEAVVPLQVRHLGEGGLDPGPGLRLADQAEVTGRDHGPQVDPDVGGRGVPAEAGRGGRTPGERDVVHRQASRLVDVGAVELPGVPRDGEQARPLRRRQPAVRADRVPGRPGGARGQQRDHDHQDDGPPVSPGSAHRLPPCQAPLGLPIAVIY